jgi:hypothetical protein
MPYKIKIFCVSLFFLFLAEKGEAQNFGLGVSAMYNFQSEGLGLGIRGNIHPNSKLSFVPQFAYYKVFLGTVNEFIVGLGIEYKLIYGNTFNYYIMAHGGYNHWLNPEESALENAQTANWNLEGGIGITTNRCLRPFLEYRYNIKFMETHLRLGLLYIFGCQGGGNGYRDARRVKNSSNCTGF